MKIRDLLVGVSLAATAVMAATAAQAATFPAFGADTGPGIIITLTDSGLSTAATGQGPYDGVEDTYVGFVNNSSHTEGSFNLGSSQCIGCFDGDGLAAYGAPTPYDANGYGGPQGFFTNNTGYNLTVNFVGGVAPGGSTYFSLEEPVSVNTLSVPEPTTWAMVLMGMGLVGGGLRMARRKEFDGAAAT